MEHSIHVSAGHFIRGVGPTSSRKILKKMKGVSKHCDQGSDDDDYSDIGSDGAGDSADDNDGGDLGFDAGDTVGKALALVTQVSLSSRNPDFLTILTWYLQIRKSPQARAFFRQVCEQVNVPKLELKLWIRTRWASLYDFIDRMITLRLVSNQSFYKFDVTECSLGRQPLHP
jgi:hypothetical protein